jgi:hypothetical protein
MADRAVTISLRNIGIVVLALAVAGLGGVIFWLAQEQGEVRKQQEGIESQLVSISSTIADLDQEMGDRIAQLGSGESAVKPLRRRLGLISDCILELQSQLSSLEVSYGFAFPNDTPSQRCNPILYGQPPGQSD